MQAVCDGRRRGYGCEGVPQLLFHSAQALQRRQTEASKRPRTVCAAEAEATKITRDVSPVFAVFVSVSKAGAVVDVPVYSQFHVAPEAHMEQIAGAKPAPAWWCESRKHAGAIGKPVAMTILPPPSLCADVGPVLIDAVSCAAQLGMQGV